MSVDLLLPNKQPLLIAVSPSIQILLPTDWCSFEALERIINTLLVKNKFEPMSHDDICLNFGTLCGRQDECACFTWYNTVTRICAVNTTERPLRDPHTMIPYAWAEQVIKLINQGCIHVSVEMIEGKGYHFFTHNIRGEKKPLAPL